LNPGTTSLVRGLAVLEALGEPSGANGLGVVALAEIVGAHKSQISRALATLE
jgi:DNA-binding IclR family transcriptional regulator